MSTEELFRLTLVQEIREGRISQRTAAAELDISVRQMRRLVRRFERAGPQGLAHRSRGKPSGRRLCASLRQTVVAFMHEEDFCDYGPTLLCETLEDEKGISVSRETMRQWMTAERRWHPCKAKVHHRQWRERKACYGQMVQMDTSIHDWFEGRGERVVLIAMIDDATSRLFCRFYRTDSTATNMSLMRDYIRRYGRPGALYVDKASHFMTTRQPTEHEQRAGKRSQTQIQRALEELDIEHIAAHSPQAKGRVERLFRTLQDRLVKGLRRARISTIDEANAYLDRQFLPLWERRFTRAPREAANVHSSFKDLNLNAIFSHQEKRHVTDDYTVCYRNQRLQIQKRSIKAGLRRNTVVIEERLDGTRKMRWRDHYLRWHALPEHAAPSPAQRREPNKPPMPDASPQKRKPAQDHPWRHGYSLMKP